MIAEGRGHTIEGSDPAENTFAAVNLQESLSVKEKKKNKARIVSGSPLLASYSGCSVRAGGRRGGRQEGGGALG